MIHINCSCCGKLWEYIPDSARVSHDEFFGGYYWECTCNSTLFVPAPDEEAA